jgi:hypothetical protein
LRILYEIFKKYSAVEWQVTTGFQCIGHPAADCTYYLSFCQTGRILDDDNYYYNS